LRGSFDTEITTMSFYPFKPIINKNIYIYIKISLTVHQNTNIFHILKPHTPIHFSTDRLGFLQITLSDKQGWNDSKWSNTEERRLIWTRKLNSNRLAHMAVAPLFIQ